MPLPKLTKPLLRRIAAEVSVTTGKEVACIGVPIPGELVEFVVTSYRSYTRVDLNGVETPGKTTARRDLSRPSYVLYAVVKCRPNQLFNGDLVFLVQKGLTL